MYNLERTNMDNKTILKILSLYYKQQAYLIDVECFDAKEDDSFYDEILDETDLIFKNLSYSDKETINYIFGSLNDFEFKVTNGNCRTVIGFEKQIEKETDESKKSKLIENLNSYKEFCRKRLDE
jgi:hypothetical protein